MAFPVLTLRTQGQSKTAGTTVTAAADTTSFALNDLVIVNLAMDPATGTVSFARSDTSAGKAVLGSFTTVNDWTHETSSVMRQVIAYAYVTTAGTNPGVVVTHPSVTARATEIYQVTGAATSSPVDKFEYESNNGTVLPDHNPPTSSAAYDALYACFVGNEEPSVSATTQSGMTGWTSVDKTSTFGTTGGSAASNQSVAHACYTKTVANAEMVPGIGFTGFSPNTGNWMTTVTLIKPAVPASLVLDDRRTRRNSLLRR